MINKKFEILYINNISSFIKRIDLSLHENISKIFYKFKIIK